jgi:signal transduction histidine kinase
MTESKKITTSIFAWLANHNGWIVTFIIVFTLGMEYYEHGGLKTDFFFVAEISFFFLSTVAVGLLVWLLTRAIKKQQLSMTILELKRWLAFEMMRQEDWDRMLELLASMPSRVARVTFAQLFIY